MTYEFFLERLKSAFELYPDSYNKEHPATKLKNVWPPLELEDGEEYLIHEWVIGGIRGNSCWGSSNERVEPEQEAPWDTLNEILEEVAPTITYLQYKRLEKLIREFETYGGSDYYGNQTDYMCKLISLKALHGFLEENNLFR